MAPSESPRSGESARGGKRARLAEVPAPACPAKRAGTAGQPDAGDSAATGGHSAPCALQAAAQGQAACCGEADASPERMPSAEGAAANPERAPAEGAEEGPAAGPERAPPAEGGTWLEVIYRLLKDLQPRRWLTCREIARCAAELRSAQSCCLAEAACPARPSLLAVHMDAGASACLRARDSCGACECCGALLLRVILV